MLVITNAFHYTTEKIYPLPTVSSKSDARALSGLPGPRLVCATSVANLSRETNVVIVAAECSSF